MSFLSRITHNAQQLQAMIQIQENNGAPNPHAAALWAASEQCPTGTDSSRWFELRALHAAGDTSIRREALAQNAVIEGGKSARRAA